MTTYKTAKELGILPEERRALIAFCKSPALGRAVALNGRSHYYRQDMVSDQDEAKQHGCGTAGCVAGYVFAHIRNVQGFKSVRGARTAEAYIERAAGSMDPWDDERGCCVVNKTIPFLHGIYSEGDDEWTLGDARRVVGRALKTGVVTWR